MDRCVVACWRVVCSTGKLESKHSDYERSRLWHMRDDLERERGQRAQGQDARCMLHAIERCGIFSCD